MPAADLHLLIDAAREAGQIATRYSGLTAQRWDKPDGAGPVTEADLAVNSMLEQRLPPPDRAMAGLAKRPRIHRTGCQKTAFS